MRGGLGVVPGVAGFAELALEVADELRDRADLVSMTRRGFAVRGETRRCVEAAEARLPRVIGVAKSVARQLGPQRLERGVDAESILLGLDLVQELAAGGRPGRRVRVHGVLGLVGAVGRRGSLGGAKRRRHQQVILAGLEKGPVPFNALIEIALLVEDVDEEPVFDNSRRAWPRGRQRSGRSRARHRRRAAP